MAKKIDVLETLKRIKMLVCIEKRYKVSKHTIVDYMNNGKCSFTDIEHCIMNSNTINGINNDTKQPFAMDGLLYTIKGKSIIGLPFYTTGKFVEEDEKEIYFFVTAHEN